MDPHPWEDRSGHGYLKLKRQLDQRVARQTLPPHPFCLADMDFSKEERTHLFRGGLTQELWTLRLLCKGAFILRYQRYEGNVPVLVETVEGSYCLAVAPDTDVDGYVPRPQQTGTLTATVALNAVLRHTENRSPVHWEEDTVITAVPFSKVYHVAVQNPSDPEWVSLCSASPELVAEGAGEKEVLMQRNRELAKMPLGKPQMQRGASGALYTTMSEFPHVAVAGLKAPLNRSLMPTDVDTRSPARFFNTGPLSSTMRKSFSTGSLRACGPSPGFGFSQRAMNLAGNQAQLVRPAVGSAPIMVHKPAPHPPYCAALRKYG
jgi:hypothetical protein